MVNNRNKKHVVARSIAKKRAEIEAPEREYIAPPMPKVAERTSAVGLFTRWALHLDGTDEHRCQTCYIAFPEGKPLCDAGQALYDASHPEQAQRQG